TISESPFSDVPANSSYAGAIKYALDTKIISQSDSFNPNNPIRYAEACKMAVSALGFDYYAIAGGGFPTGYIKAAAQSDLLIGVSGNEILTYADALTIISNFMYANVYVESGYNETDGGTAILSQGDTVLKYHHDVEILEDAIITATVFSGLYEATGACDESEIEIDNKTYKYSGNSVELVGKCADVYYKKDGARNTVLYLEATPAAMITLKSSDILSAANQTVEYTTGTTPKTLRLLLSPSFIYNNCADTTLTLDYLTTTDAELTFIDNDLNGIYDVVYINESTVSVVERVSVYDELIVCDDDTILNFSDKDGVYYIEKEGKQCELVDIKADDVLWIYRSHLPNNAIVVYVAEKQIISGTVTGIDSSNRMIYIDDTAYAYNKSFETKGLSLCAIGTKVTVVLNSLGQVAACTDNDTKAEYGYCISLRKASGLEELVELKMLNADGKIEIYTIDKSVTFDGKTTTRADAYDKLNTYINDSKTTNIIRYIASSDKLLKMIDIHNDNSKGIVDDNMGSNDRLSIFVFPESGFTNSDVFYNGGTMMFHPHFQATATTRVFKIIEDEKVEESQRYTVTTPSYFSSIRFVPKKDNSGNECFFAYDVVESGQVGAIVYKADAGGTNVNQESNSGIIYSANPAVSPAGENAVALVVYKSGKYQRFYIEDEMVLKTISADASFSNIPLKQGDYIKYNSSTRGEITGIVKDFDYQSKEVLDTFENHMLYGYYYGKIYDCKDGVISLMPENFDKDKPAETDGAYRYRFKLPGSITVYDSKSKTMYQGSYADVVTYLQSKTDCHKILLKMYEGNIRDAVLFK
ncbi:MAG: S-layer homology domain-containing protein, partial [Clostridia bacterium]|nr:S-layer homology domain-containing protein [Clostridia bacterium]